MESSLIWYHIENDQIFLSAQLDALFYALAGNIDWCKVDLIGAL